VRLNIASLQPFLSLTFSLVEAEAIWMPPAEFEGVRDIHEISVNVVI
jgi:hypothetical protein